MNETSSLHQFTRRGVLAMAGAFGASMALIPTLGAAQQNQPKGDLTMATITTTDGTNIFYKDWGPKDAQPIVFHHGWRGCSGHC